MWSGTRGDFFQSINQIGQDEYPTIINDFFDQFSVLYNIIGGYENLQVSKDASKFAFNIHTPSPEIASDIVARTNGEVVHVYDRTFSIYSTLLGPSEIYIQIT